MDKFTVEPSELTQKELEDIERFRQAVAGGGQLFRVRAFMPKDEKFPDDCRPLHWPIKWPYWCSGGNDTHHVLIILTDCWEYIAHNWPGTEIISFAQPIGYPEEAYSGRFQKPDWYNPNTL